MEQKAKFFRNIVANLVLIAVLSVTIVFVSGLPSPNVATVEPIRGGNCEQSVSIAITLDRDSASVDDILSVLQSSEIQATFFVSGAWAIENADALRAIYNQGHELGNYGFFNVAHRGLPPSRIVDEIELTHKLVQQKTGMQMSIFLPPQASYSEATIEIARALGYTTVSPPNRVNFTPDLSSQQLITKSTQNLTGGAFIILPATPAASAALNQIVSQIINQNFNIVPIKTVIGD